MNLCSCGSRAGLQTWRFYRRRDPCDIEAKPPPAKRAGRHARSLRLEQLEVRQMLAGTPARARFPRTGSAATPATSRSRPGSVDHGQRYVDGVGPTGRQERQRPTRTGSCSSTRRRPSGIASAAGRPVCCRTSGEQFQILEGLGAVGEVLVRSYGSTAAQATAALQSDRQISWFEADSLKQIDAGGAQRQPVLAAVGPEQHGPGRRDAGLTTSTQPRHGTSRPAAATSWWR